MAETAPKVWRNNTSGELFHDGCFDEGETRDGFTPVKLTELTEDDECEACSGVFLSGLEPDDDDDEAAEEDVEDDD